MKKRVIYLLLILTVCSLNAAAQREDYKLREQSAATQTKNRLNEIRNRVAARRLTFGVGYTYALERGVEEISGGVKPNVSAAEARRQNELARQLIKIDDDARIAAKVPDAKAACSINSKTWDWRKQGKVTPIRQQKCGNCWAYAALAAFESNYLIRNNFTLDGSEQYVVSNNNNKAGKCEKPGGVASLAIEFLVTGGTTTEAIMPDLGITGLSNPNITAPYNGVAWGYANEDNPGNPGVNSIKETVCNYGGATTWIDANGTFGAYTGAGDGGDVYNDDDDKEPGHKVGGHFVTIIGWDENRGAWLVKNSWGENWGFEAGHGTQRGYGWIKYGTHSVGSWVTWIRAESSDYKLPKIYYDLMPVKRVKILDIKQPITKPNIRKS